ncbi:carbohydrate binding domain-containing protein [Carboxylicivirga sp. M1479]|uniref:carbohydrate binding domain-containing protein n=1 Tax=Carboxylicivirga sp. M1479 TaxID=2594476 RepID=UPI001177C19D|nr:carbohydrate binding domain-containing protein [Carboxylicivirga sp. M1479]TRX63981.1 T9SS type A sorting domain-containing protein [Carboxylicivirga sp. M1479]
MNIFNNILKNVFVLIVLMLGSTQFGAGQNLVQNGTFEDHQTEDLRVFDGPWRGNKINWDKDGPGSALASEEAVFEGEYGFFFKRDASDLQQNNITIWQDVPVVAGKVYEFSFMAKLQNTTDNVLRFGIKKMVDGSPVDVWLWKQDTLEVNEYSTWKSYEGTVTIPDNSDGVRLNFFRNPGGDSCFIDNVILTEYIPEPDENLIKNGYFEDNQTEDLRVFDGPWRGNKINWEKDGPGTALASEEAKYEGNYSFFFKRDASDQQQNNITIWQDVSVEAGRVYEFSFMAKLQNTNDNVLRFGIKKMVDGSPVDVWIWKQDTLEVSEFSNWNNYKGAITIPHNASGVRFNFFRNPGGDSCFIDNVILKPIDLEPKTYYVSSSMGNDDDDGLSPQTAWKSLDRVNEAVLVPSDTVYFKANDEFIGQLRVGYSGTVGKNIVFTRYGEGNKPRLNGSGGEGGDYSDVVYIENQEYIEVSSLEISNDRRVPRSGDKDTRCYGVHVRNSGPESKEHFRLRDLTIMDIYPVTIEGVEFQYVDVAGIYFYTTENWPANPKHMRDIIVEDCLITRTGKFGVWVKHNGIAQEGVGNDTINKNMDVIVRNNHILETGGSGITVSRAYNVLLENNLIRYPGYIERDERMIGRGSGTWMYSVINGISQYNHIYHPRGHDDSYGQHIDYQCRNIIYQYNYSEDSEGGFAQILGNNFNCTYRFNISVNDGFREVNSVSVSGNSLKVSNFSRPERILSDSCYFYNNTIYVDKLIEPCIYFDAKKVFVYNNIFQALNYGSIGKRAVITNYTKYDIDISNNLFDGAVTQLLKVFDSNMVSGDPGFKNPGGYLPDDYSITKSCNAIGNGLSFVEPHFPMAGKGIFKDIPSNPIVDIFGNPIDIQNIRPNIGAQAGNGANQMKCVNDLALMVNPVRNSIVLSVPENNTKGSYGFQIVDMAGKVIQNLGSFEPVGGKVTIPLSSGLYNGVYILRINEQNRQYGLSFLYLKE